MRARRGQTQHGRPQQARSIGTAHIRRKRGERERRSGKGWATGAQQGVAAGDACSAGEASAAQHSQARRGARGRGARTVGVAVDAAPARRSAAAVDAEDASPEERQVLGALPGEDPQHAAKFTSAAEEEGGFI